MHPWAAANRGHCPLCQAAQASDAAVRRRNCPSCQAPLWCIRTPRQFWYAPAPEMDHDLYPPLPADVIVKVAPREFMQRMLDARLLTTRDTVWPGLAAAAEKLSPRELAALAIEQRALTTWQARKLLNGQWKGMHDAGLRLLTHMPQPGPEVTYLGIVRGTQLYHFYNVFSTESGQDIELRWVFIKQHSQRIRHPGLVQVSQIETRGMVRVIEHEINGVRCDRLLNRGFRPTGVWWLEQLGALASAVSACHLESLFPGDFMPYRIVVNPDGTTQLVISSQAEILGMASDTPGTRRVTREGRLDFERRDAEKLIDGMLVVLLGVDRRTARSFEIYDVLDASAADLPTPIWELCRTWLTTPTRTRSEPWPTLVEEIQTTWESC